MVVTLYFLNSCYSSATGFGCFWPVYRPLPSWLSFVWSLEVSKEWNKLVLFLNLVAIRRRSVFLRTSTSVRALWWNHPKDIPTWNFSNLPMSVVSSIGGMTVEALNVLANAFWNGERGRHEPKPRSTHTSQVVGPGEAPSRVSSRPDELPPAIFTVEAIREIC